MAGSNGLKRWVGVGALSAVWLGLVGCGPTDDAALGVMADDGVPPSVQAGIDVPQLPAEAQAAQDGDGAARATKAIRDTRAQVGGRWAPPFDMSVIAIHMALQPDGRVLYFGSDTDGRQTAARQYGVWDPAAPPAQAVMTLDNTTGTDIFCSSQTLLGDGSTLIVGGDRPGGGNAANRESTRFSPATNSLVKGRAMSVERWYSSTTMLMDGRVYIQGGSGGQARPEIYDPRDGSFRRLEGANTSGLFYAFPRNWVAPDERVFGIDGAGRMYYVDPRGAGALTRAGDLPAAAVGGSAGAAMFRPGRILALSSATQNATVIDIRGSAPQVGTTEAASARRIHGVATVLADGRVLASGGGRTNNVLGTAVLSGEVWNPVTGEWTIGPEQRNARLYHGTALLLHDGRVLVAGGGAPGPLSNRNGELYSPSYLFDAEGRPAPRPRIERAPDVVDPGRSFEVVTAGRPIARVTLVRFGSVSHSWNSDQRFVELPFRADAGDGRLVVQLPSRAADTPPGFYMLFAFDEAGVPSVARTVRIVEPRDDAAAAALGPVVEPIADLRWTGGAVSVAPRGHSPAGRALRWSASGLPPGIAIDPVSGRVSGQPGARGDWFVTVAADDGERTGTQSFLWSVQPSDVRVERIDAPGPVELGQATEFAARVQGSGLTYTWDFGDGSRVTARSTSPTVRHTYARPGTYSVTLTVYDALGRPTSRSVLQTVHRRVEGPMPSASSMLAVAGEGAQARLWVANPDAGTVAAFDAAQGTKLAEIRTGDEPVTLAVAGDGRVWVANRTAATLSVIDPVGLSVVRTVSLPRGSRPYGVVADTAGGQLFVALEAGGRVLRFDARSLAQTGETEVGADVRHLALTGDGRTLYVSRFITPPLPGESGRVVRTAAGGGEVIRVDARTMRVVRTILLRHDNREDGETQGRGLPNYLGAMAISPDGTQGYVPSKQDNVARGLLRDGRELDFQNTVRAVSSRIRLASQDEDLPGRIDHDNASLASAAAFDPIGALLFVALETSAEVAVADAHTGQPLLRVPTGLAPRAVKVSPDGTRLYVVNYMGRSVSVFGLERLRRDGQLELPLLATLRPMAVEPLAPAVLLGKQLFHDASDPRLARDRYMSCASCHADGGADGRTWDFSGFGEGLRNTVPLRGRAGMAHGRLHWSGNFDEVQDFEGQIRRFAGGTGLMSDAAWSAGTRREPLGDRKAGASAELDALAAYVASLNRFDPSPYRDGDGSLTATGRAGEALFVQKGCTACHGGRDFTASATRGPVDIGTLRQPTSGRRLGQPLTGIDPPTLRDAWATAPYLHDGSAPTLVAAIRAHRDVVLTDGEAAQLARYVAEIGDGPAPSNGSDPGGNGERPGLLGTYFEGIVPGEGAVRAVRNESIDFDWGGGAPPGATADRFSVRWTGELVAPMAGRYRFRTISDDGVRLWVGGTPLIDQWTLHAPTAHLSGWVTLEAGQRYPVRLDYFENYGGATIRLQWITPGTMIWRAVPASVLRSPAAGG